MYVRKERKEMIFLLCLFKITLDYMYQFIIKKEYINILILSRGYSRNAFSFEFNLSKYVLSCVIAFAFIFILVKKIIIKDRAHEILMLGLSCISFLPSLTLFAFSNLEWRFFICLICFWSCFYMAIFFICSKNSNLENINRNVIDSKYAKIIFWMISVIFIIGSILLAYRYLGSIHVSLDFSSEDVYASRLLARGKFGTFLNYFRNNAMYIVLPLLCIVFLVKKNYIMLVFGLWIIVLLFNIDSQKTVLMLTLVSICAALIVKRKASKVIIRGLAGINIITIIIYSLTNNLVLVDALIKRIYFLPAIIGKCQYEYVNSHQHVILMSSLLSKTGILKDYQYHDLALPFTIGREYFGSNQISANTGGFAGAYIYGGLGLILIPIAYAIIFKLLDIVSTNLQLKCYISIIIIQIFVISGTNITSVLTVYGLGLAVILLLLMNNNTFFKINKKTKFLLH